MSLLLHIKLSSDITAEIRIQEINLLVALFDDLFPRQRYSRESLMSKVSYVLEVQLEEFPSTPEQLAYLESRNWTLTGTPNVACGVCEPVTGQLVAQVVKEEV